MRLSKQRVFSLLERELREYRTSLLWTPLLISTLLALLMLASVLLVNRVSVFGDAVMQIIEQQSRGGVVVLGEEGADKSKGRALQPGVDFTLSEEVQPLPEDAWDFAARWRARAPDWLVQRGLRVQASTETRQIEASLDVSMEGLNPVLSVLHNILLLVLFITSTHYLLSALFDDRKDRSILFWRSLPVRDWETVLSKFAVALLLAPAVVLTLSALLQIAYVLLAMLLLWRLDMAAGELILANVAVGRLLVDQLGGWLLTALWIAPVYAWFLLASAAARRTPFLFAVTPVLLLVLLDEFVLGTGRVLPAITAHLPHLNENSSMGFYLFGPDWMGLDLPQLAGGLVFAGLCLFAAVYLRRHRWEL